MSSQGKGRDHLQVPPSSTRLIFSNYLHTINLLHRFLLPSELGGNVTCSKLAGFTVMSFYCLRGRFGDEKIEREMLSRSAHRCRRLTFTPEASVLWKLVERKFREFVLKKKKRLCELPIILTVKMESKRMASGVFGERGIRHPP